MSESREIPVGLLNKLDKDLHVSDSAIKSQKLAEFDGEKINGNSKKGLLEPFVGDPKDYLSTYGKLFNNPDQEDRERRLEKFKEELLYPSVLGEIIYSKQKQSLDIWVDYLASPEAQYPTWFKYYVLRSVIKMGVYNKGEHEFSRRTKDTMAAFPNLDKDALAYSYDVLKRYYIEKGGFEDNNLDGEEKGKLVKILASAKFARIYAFALEKTSLTSKEDKEKIEGSWVKFDKGSDSKPFFESLQGYDTGWCTNGRAMAEEQLKGGDFYVYYTKNEHGKDVIPRVAIRTWLGRVFEVRGIEADQNLEGNMLDIAREKYLLLPDGEKYEKKYEDMKLLTLIDEKTRDGEDLTIDELMFLYEIDRDMEVFGTKSDSRVREVISRRDAKADLSLLTGFAREEISLTNKEALSGGIKYHQEDLSFFDSEVLPEGSIFPEIVFGNLKLNNLLTVDGVTLPKVVKGDFNLSRLVSANGLVLPKIVGGDLSLSGLTSIEGLILPEVVGGKIYLSGLSVEEKETLRQRYPNLRIV